MKEINSYNKLIQYYENKNILTGKEPIQVDLNSLGLDLGEEGLIELYTESEKDEFQTITMKKVVEDVLEQINKLIQNKSDKESVQGKRYILLNTNKKPLNQYTSLGLPKHYYTEEEEKMGWLNRIIAALIDKGHIFKLDKVNGHGYFIQV